jgi:hypothetical protein
MQNLKRIAQPTYVSQQISEKASGEEEIQQVQQAVVFYPSQISGNVLFFDKSNSLIGISTLEVDNGKIIITYNENTVFNLINLGASVDTPTAKNVETTSSVKIISPGAAESEPNQELSEFKKTFSSIDSLDIKIGDRLFVMLSDQTKNGYPIATRIDKIQ